MALSTINTKFQIYVILNGIKTVYFEIKGHHTFQIYVILNGIKTYNCYDYCKYLFQIYVILNGIKTIALLMSIVASVLDLCYLKWY